MGGFRELEELFLSPFCSSICILSSTGESHPGSVPEPGPDWSRDVDAPSQRLGCFRDPWQNLANGRQVSRKVFFSHPQNTKPHPRWPLY